MVGTPHPPHRDTRTHTHTHTQTPAQITVLIPVLGKDVTDMSIVQIHGTGHLQQMAITIIQLRILLLLLQDTVLSFGQIHCYQQPKGELLLPFPRVRLTGPTFVGTPSLPPGSFSPTQSGNLTEPVSSLPRGSTTAMPSAGRLPATYGFPSFPGSPYSHTRTWSADRGSSSVSYLVLSITRNCLQLPASVLEVIALQPLRLRKRGRAARGGHPPPA